MQRHPCRLFTVCRNALMGKRFFSAPGANMFANFVELLVLRSLCEPNGSLLFQRSGTCLRRREVDLHGYSVTRPCAPSTLKPWRFRSPGGRHGSVEARNRPAERCVVSASTAINGSAGTSTFTETSSASASSIRCCTANTTTTTTTISPTATTTTTTLAVSASSFEIESKCFQYPAY